MPKVAYSEEERIQIRNDLICAALDLMSKQGMQHTTIEQIYKKVGISRTFFYSFFPTKEDLVIEALYDQQPKIVSYAQSLVADPKLSWREAITQFFYSCCHSQRSGFTVLNAEEQKLLFQRLSKESYAIFRQKQFALFGKILECFGVEAKTEYVNLFINMSLTVILIHRSIPNNLPLFVPEVREETTQFQIEAIIDFFEKRKIK